MDIAKGKQFNLQSHNIANMPPKKRNANTGKQPPGNKVVTTADKQKLGQRKGRASVNKVTPEAKNPK